MKVTPNHEFERTAQRLRESVRYLGRPFGFGKVVAVTPLNSTLDVQGMEKGPYAVLAVKLPEELFPDDDDVYCLTAGTHIAHELGAHLEKRGHSIPEWVRGGCREDAWVYLETEKDGTRYGYVIVFFPRDDHDTRTMAVQYEIRQSFFQRWLRGRIALGHDDPLHALLKQYGDRYEESELLTQSEFDSQY